VNGEGDTGEYSDDYEEEAEGEEDRPYHQSPDNKSHRAQQSTTSVVLGEEAEENDRPEQANIDGGASVQSSRTMQMSLSDASLHVAQEETIIPQSIGDGSLDKILFGGSTRNGSSLYALDFSTSTKKGGVPVAASSLDEDPSYNISIDSSLLAGMNATANMSGKGSTNLSTPVPPTHRSASSSRSGASVGSKRKAYTKKKGGGSAAVSTSSSQPRMSASTGGVEVIS
jgi:hypothetical protein